MTKKLTPVVEAPTTSKMAGIYNEPPKPAVRPGADNHLKYPSRMGQSLLYKDGREEKLK